MLADIKVQTQYIVTFEQSSTPSALPADDRNFPHLHFEFLQPDRVRDAQKRCPDDMQYDPKTLYVPDSFLCKQTPVCIAYCFFLRNVNSCQAVCSLLWFMIVSNVLLMIISVTARKHVDSANIHQC